MRPPAPTSGTGSAVTQTSRSRARLRLRRPSSLHHADPPSQAHPDRARAASPPRRPCAGRGVVVALRLVEVPRERCDPVRGLEQSERHLVASRLVRGERRVRQDGPREQLRIAQRVRDAVRGGWILEVPRVADERPAWSPRAAEESRRAGERRSFVSGSPATPRATSGAASVRARRTVRRCRRRARGESAPAEFPRTAGAAVIRRDRPGASRAGSTSGIPPARAPKWPYTVAVAFGRCARPARRAGPRRSDAVGADHDARVDPGRVPSARRGRRPRRRRAGRGRGRRRSRHGRSAPPRPRGAHEQGVEHGSPGA